MNTSDIIPVLYEKHGGTIMRTTPDDPNAKFNTDPKMTPNQKLTQTDQNRIQRSLCLVIPQKKFRV